MNRWNLTTLYLILILLAGGLAFAGTRFSLPVLTNLALLCIGLLMALVGGELILTRRAEFALGGWSYIQGKETFKGLAAQLWGILFLGMGLLAILGTLAKWLFPAQTHSIWGGLQGTPAGAGLALTGLGIAAGLYGTIRLLAGSAGVDLGRMTGVSNLLDRIGGAILLLIGLGLISIGSLLILAPGIVSAVFAQVVKLILQ